MSIVRCAWVRSAARGCIAVRALVFVACLGSVFAGSARAQALSGFPDRPYWEDAPPLPLAAALLEATSRNPTLVARRAEVAPLEARVAAEQSLMPPRIESQIWQWPVTTLNPSKVDMYMFMLEQEFPGRGKRDAREALASREAAMAAVDVDSERLAVAGAVRRAYAALALARRDILAAADAGRALESLVEAAQTTYGAGSGSQAGVVRAMLEVTRVRERLTELSGEERMAAARLNSLMNRPPDAAIGRLDSPADTAGPDEATLVARAVESHPEIRAAKAAIARADAGVALSGLEKKPDWMVKGGYMLMPGEAGAWTASVGVTWPSAPWARQRLTAVATEAERQRDAARARLSAVEARVRLMVQEAAARERAARARLGVLRGTLVPQAQHLVDATRLAFEAGQGSLTEVLEARQVLLEAELDAARAATAVELARAELDAASGDDWLAPLISTQEH